MCGGVPKSKICLFPTPGKISSHSRFPSHQMFICNMANDNSSNNEELIIDNTFDQNDYTIIDISDDLNKLKAKVIT